MTRDNVIAILGILKTAYPKFYKEMKKTEAEETISLWQEMFSDTDIRILTIAVKRLITHFEFPPTIADVKKEILKITTKQENNIDYWQEVLKMMSNSLYMKKEEFDNYSDICKRFFGNVDNLRSYGEMEKQEVINNIQPRFLKYAENYQKEKNENMRLPNDYKDMVKKLCSNFDINQIEGEK